MSAHLLGIGVSAGLVIGKACILRRGDLQIPEYEIAEQDIGTEIRRFRAALMEARVQFRETHKRLPVANFPELAAFVETHLLMLADSAFTEVPEQLIAEQRRNAEWALKTQRDALVRMFDAMQDPYLAMRRDDVDHVVSAVQRVLLQHPMHAHDLREDRLRGSIVVADQLTPSDTVLLQDQGVAGFVTEYGGPMSHTAILARSLEIPAIVGVRNACRLVREGETIVVDGRDGALLLDPDAAALRQYRARQREERQYRANLQLLREKPSVTRDGRRVTLLANIELPEDVRAMKRVGAAGVGLYRTEFLYMNRQDAPDEEEHFQAYQQVIRGLRGLPLTIRTLDIGGDKPAVGARPSSNPALGLRAVRLCLRDLDLFRPQLRAILRASAHGPLRIMIPMVAALHEIEQVRRLIDEARAELDDRGQEYASKVALGIMVEVPAAAVVASILVKHVDFLSIGTNDLIQYTLAIDRVDDEVNYLYDPLHPAVLKLLHMTIQAGRRAGKPVSLCGEMAGDPRYTRLLLGMGLTEFSMPPSAFLEVKRIVRESHSVQLTRFVQRILRTSRPARIAQLVAEMNGE